jgi:methylase of polypeptide subunit release factors
MSSSSIAPPPFFNDSNDYSRAREVLSTAGYDEETVRRKLGRYIDAKAADLPVWFDRTRGGEPLDGLIRLFLLGVALSEPEAEKAISPLPLQSWIDGRLLRRDGVLIRGTVSLMPQQGLVIATDWAPPLQTSLDEDHVMAVGPSSVLLAATTIRKPAKRALDLGCGSGFQALLLARHADEVLAVDRNPRALRMAEFNAQLNGIRNLEWVQGDFFQPCKDRLFDHIVSQPPYVVSPETRFVYRDSGHARDELCRNLVRDSASHLNEGGFCQMLCHWVHLTGESWQSRLSSWFEGTGCDVWVMKMETEEPAAYAAKWCGVHTPNLESRLAETQKWQDYYRQEGIEAISGGLITMRRRSPDRGRSNFIALKDAPERIARPCGDSIANLFAARDLLDSLDERQFLLLKLRCAEGLRLTQELKTSFGGWTPNATAEAPTGMRLSLVADWTYSCRTDSLVAQLLAHFDGSKTLGDVLRNLAESMKTDLDRIKPGALPIVRELVEWGGLVPVGS